MLKQVIKKVVAAGVILCMVAGPVLITPPTLVSGYVYVVPFSGHCPIEEYD